MVRAGCAVPANLYYRHVRGKPVLKADEAPAFFIEASAARRYPMPPWEGENAMPACDVCKKRRPSKDLARRLAIPEYRAMIGFWPWVEVRVCPACLEAHDRDFLERLRLLAPDVVENDEPIVGPVCLSCGRVGAAGRSASGAGTWTEASKWLDAGGRPARRSAFRLCAEHRDQVYIDGIVVTSNLAGAAALGSVLDELPSVAADLLERVEGWHAGDGPAGAEDFAPERSRDEALRAALDFWEAAPEGLEAKAAWLGPIRKDYRMRYRLDLVRDLAGGRRETLVVLRAAGGKFTTYRLAGRRA